METVAALVVSLHTDTGSDAQVAGQLEARWCVPAVPNHGPI